MPKVHIEFDDQVFSLRIMNSEEHILLHLEFSIQSARQLLHDRWRHLLSLLIPLLAGLTIYSNHLSIDSSQNIVHPVALEHTQPVVAK